MSDAVQFETPENIQVKYRAAGLGTRFMAWAIDQIFVSIAMFIVFLGLVVLAATFEAIGSTSGEVIDQIVLDEDSFEDPEQLGMYFIGLSYLVLGLGSFFYFGLCELLMRGQTFGKRSANVRVVKTDGFSLDVTSIFLRNLFRVVDQLPPLWVVPVFSSRGQRFGDMVSSTIVIAEGEAELPRLRAKLAELSPTDAQYRFDASALKRLRPQDIEAIEKLLERWASLSPEDRLSMTAAILPPIANRLEVEAPTIESVELARRFLEDLLAAEYRRRNRAL